MALNPHPGASLDDFADDREESDMVEFDVSCLGGVNGQVIWQGSWVSSILNTRNSFAQASLESTP